jgi:putative addiction module killer protein
MKPIKIVVYETKGGKKPFDKWFDDLDGQIQRIIAVRTDRMSVGNFGDCFFLREEVWELRIHFGAGYRVYFGKHGNTLVIVLSGGLKKSQEKDIDKAIAYWKSYKEEHHG